MYYIVEPSSDYVPLNSALSNVSTVPRPNKLAYQQSRLGIVASRTFLAPEALPRARYVVMDIRVLEKQDLPWNRSCRRTGFMLQKPEL